MSVVSFEANGAAIRRLGEAASLAEASAGLPPGAYTSLRTYGGARVVRLAQHVQRLQESVQIQGLPAPLEIGSVAAALAASLAAAGHSESRVRLTFAPPRLFVSVEPFEPVPPALYRDGVACLTFPFRRENPHAKDTRFIATAAGAYGTLPPGIHEGLLLDDDGSLLEGLSSNFFAVRNGVLQTEEERVLLGVTRALVLEAAAGLLPVERVAVRKAQLGETTEAFLTSVSRGVLPVVRIDGATLGVGRPGPHTRAIMAAFEDLVRREARPVRA